MFNSISSGARVLAVACWIGGIVAAAPCVMASPASGVTPTVLARGKYEPFKVSKPTGGSVDFDASATTAVDMVVRQHDYAPGSSTGWHGHPGPVFITVTKGQVTFYELTDPNCTPHRVSAGQGYEDTGEGHIGRNESGEAAQDISVIMAPVGGAFRTELPAPGPHCKF